MALRKKVVYMSEEFTGSIITCSCGAVYKVSERVFVAEDEEDTVVRKSNYCSFCNKYIGEFDSHVIILEPRKISFAWIKFKKNVKVKIRNFWPVVIWHFKSSGFLIRYRIERIAEWMKGLLRQLKQFRSPRN